METTAVACRELGYTAGDAFPVVRQVTESSRRLSYMPQCVGEQSGSCDAPVVIRCSMSSSKSTTQLSSTMTAPKLLASSTSKPVPVQHSSTYNATMFKPQPSATKASSTATYSFVTDLFPSSSTNSSSATSSSPLYDVPGAVGVAVGGLVVLLLAAAVTLLVLLLLCRKKKKFLPQPAVYDMVLPVSPCTRNTLAQPYEVPVSNRSRNYSNSQETECFTPTAGQPPFNDGRYNRLIHFPASNSTVTASFMCASVNLERVMPSSFQAHQSRGQSSKGKCPIYHNVVISRKSAAEYQYNVPSQHQYDTLGEKVADDKCTALERPTQKATKIFDGKSEYDVLEPQKTRL
ncbi:hypothetical protein GBAR_LOCUS14131 [Geodia barretti]|uniref:Uncharacterized protein n=2 Tax=Geodia barretti TaxID=519541 RepID=A0AA35WL13_GEOBA|nr:hypothetical protein GBAR_LOCUS14131 [Geodia barretti]